MKKSKQCILVCEDERAMAHALELKLTKAGYEVVSAQNGDEALHLCASTQFDLILLDIIMPVRDGFSVLAELKSKQRKTPIIVLSNLSQQEDETHARELGAVDYCIKSNMSLPQIIERVASLVRKT